MKQKTLNLDKLESKLDDSLAKETKESLSNWLNGKRNKQETLEEAAKKYCLINNISTDQMIVKNDRSCEFETPITMFTRGAQWQAERMYSEEEVLNILQEFKRYLSFGNEVSQAEWFEQFKKK